MKDSLEKLYQLYLQAKQNGDSKLIKFYKDMILKLGGTPPKI